MCHCPTGFRIEPTVEVRVRIVQQLRGPEAVEAQQPVRLIQPMLPQQRRFCVESREEAVLHHRHICRVKHPLEPVLLVQRLRQSEDVPVIIAGGAHDKLRALPGRGKHRRVPVLGKLRLTLAHAVPYLSHGPQDRLLRLIRRQRLQAGLRRQLNVDAETVRQQAQLFHQLRGRAGNGLGVDVAVEPVLLPQDAKRPYHLLGSIVRAAQYTAGKKQPFDVIPPVKTDGQLCKLSRRERRPPRVVAAPIDTIFAVEGADIGHQYLQQRDAAAIRRKAVAASGDGGGGVADHAGSGPALHTAGGAGRIVLGGIRQDRQLLQNIHAVTPCGVCGGEPDGRCSR